MNLNNSLINNNLDYIKKNIFILLFCVFTLCACKHSGVDSLHDDGYDKVDDWYSAESDENLDYWDYYWLAIKGDAEPEDNFIQPVPENIQEKEFKKFIEKRWSFVFDQGNKFETHYVLELKNKKYVSMWSNKNKLIFDKNKWEFIDIYIWELKDRYINIYSKPGGDDNLTFGIIRFNKTWYIVNADFKNGYQKLEKVTEE